MSFITSSGIPHIYRIDGNNQVLFELCSLIQDKSINPYTFKRAELLYSVGKKNEYPLKFISKDIEVWISGVKTGFKKEGSKNIIKALSFMGFKLGKDDKEQILCHKNVNITFEKILKSQP